MEESKKHQLSDSDTSFLKAKYVNIGLFEKALEMGKLQPSDLVTELMTVIDRLIGSGECVGEKPFTLDVANRQENLLYKIEIRKGDDRMTIMNRVSNNPSLVKSYHFSQNGDSRDYDDPYLEKYGESSINDVVHLFSMLNIAMHGFSNDT